MLSRAGDLPRGVSAREAVPLIGPVMEERKVVEEVQTTTTWTTRGVPLQPFADPPRRLPILRPLPLASPNDPPVQIDARERHSSKRRLSVQSLQDLRNRLPSIRPLRPSSARSPPLRSERRAPRPPNLATSLPRSFA